jgi:hypothetical protein
MTKTKTIIKCSDHKKHNYDIMKVCFKIHVFLGDNGICVCIHNLPHVAIAPFLSLNALWNNLGYCLSND